MEKEKEYLNRILDEIKTQVEETICSYKQILKQDLHKKVAEHIKFCETEMDLARKRYVAEYNESLEMMGVNGNLNPETDCTYERQIKFHRNILESKLRSSAHVWLRQIEYCLANMD